MRRTENAEYAVRGCEQPREVCYIRHIVRERYCGPIPVRDVLPWAIFGMLVLFAIYFVGVEEGATSLINGMYVHEFVHDGRQKSIARSVSNAP